MHLRDVDTTLALLFDEFATLEASEFVKSSLTSRAVLFRESGRRRVPWSRDVPPEIVEKLMTQVHSARFVYCRTSHWVRNYVDPAAEGPTARAMERAFGLRAVPEPDQRQDLAPERLKKMAFCVRNNMSMWDLDQSDEDKDQDKEGEAVGAKAAEAEADAGVRVGQSRALRPKGRRRRRTRERGRRRLLLLLKRTK